MSTMVKQSQWPKWPLRSLSSPALPMVGTANFNVSLILSFFLRGSLAPIRFQEVVGPSVGSQKARLLLFT